MIVLRTLWRQLPFFVWLVALWMLLWGQFTVLSAVTGIVVAFVVTRVFVLPPAELSGRLNPLWAAWYILTFLSAVAVGSLTVAWQAVDWRRQPGSAVIAARLRTDDDMIMTLVGVTASLIPGSLVLHTDRRRRIIYLHFIGVRTMADVDLQRAHLYRWEERIVRAIGSRAQVALVQAAPGDRFPQRGAS